MTPRDDAPRPVVSLWDHPAVPAGLGILAVIAIALTVGLLS